MHVSIRLIVYQVVGQLKFCLEYTPTLMRNRNVSIKTTINDSLNQELIQCHLVMNFASLPNVVGIPNEALKWRVFCDKYVENIIIV